MRVAVWHDLPGGGGKRALRDHVAGLVARGHEVTSWCTPWADQDFLPLGDLVPEHVVPMRALPIRRMTAWADRLTKGALSAHVTVRAMDEHARAVAAQINKGAADVVLVNSSFSVGTSPLSRYLDKPSVLYLQEPKRSLYEAAPRLPWPAMPRPRSLIDFLYTLRDSTYVRSQRVLAREELLSAQAYGRILVNSYFSRESVIRAYGVEAMVCYLGVDADRYRDNGQERGRTVVGTGEFSHHKRQDAVIRAIATIPEPRPILDWVGNRANREYLAELSQLARQLGVCFRPHVSVPHDHVVSVLNSASVLVYAPRLEPFGYAPIEGAACSLPVVAMAEGGVRESVQHGKTGFLVDSEPEMGRMVEALLSDPVLARRMGEAGRENALKNWSLEAAVDRLEHHLKEVASGADRLTRSPSGFPGKAGL